MSKNKHRIKTSIQDKPTESGIVARLVEDTKEEFKFSLKHLQDSSEKFCYDNKSCNYYCSLLERMRDLSKESVSGLMRDRGKKSFYRFHDIKWDDVTENGFTFLNEQLQSCRPWQFQITSNEHGRVHGFFIGTTYYVVWLDPDHNLYS